MFGIILISACTGMHIYVFWRAASVPFLNRTIPRMYLIGSGVVLWVSFILAWTLGHGAKGSPAVILELFSMHWMALLFLCSVTLCFIDLLTGFGYLLPRQSPTLRG